MGDEPLTKKLLEDVLDAKLSPLKAKIDQLSDKMAEFQQFIDEANKNYEDTNKRMSSMQERFNCINAENLVLKETVRQLEVNISDFKVICNEQEQYLRRECLEIQGIPLPSKDSQHIEDTNKIVIQVGELMGVQIQAEDISISHRLPLSSKYKGKRRLSAIIVKFVRRSTKEAYYCKRKDLHAFTTKDLGFKEENHIYVNESLTERNKELFNAAFKVKKDCSYDFIWTPNGEIFLRDNKDSPAKLIRSEVDLSKLKQR